MKLSGGGTYCVQEKPAENISADAGAPAQDSIDRRTGRHGKGSIEIASAEALRILQRHYGATARNSTGPPSQDAERGEQRGPLHIRESSSCLVLLTRDPKVKNCAAFAFVAPLLILGPWLNGVLGTLVRAFARTFLPNSILSVPSSAEALEDAEVGAVGRLAAALVGGSVIVLFLKLLLTAPGIRYGGNFFDLFALTPSSGRRDSIQGFSPSFVASTDADDCRQSAPGASAVIADPALQGSQASFAHRRYSDTRQCGGGDSSAHQTLLPEPLLPPA